jgi:hypothetical protein
MLASPCESALARWRVACHDHGVHRPRASIRSLSLLALLGLTALAGCSKKPPAEVADRLWVAQMPTGPRSQIDAFVLTQAGKRSVGTFYHGSLFRGAHDSFLWTTKSNDRGVIHLLQDQRDFEVRTKPCKPDSGFDQCILLEGDPKKVVRYQSRKRWAIPRRGKSLDVPALVVELGEEDEQLQALVEAE